MSGKRESATLEEIRAAYVDFSSLRSTKIRSVMLSIAEAIERVKVSIILPQIISNYRVMTEVLTGTEFEPLIKLVNDILRRLDIILKEKRPPLLDHGMIRIIDFVQRNKNMYSMFPRFVHGMSESEEKLLNAFNRLYELAERRLTLDAKAHIRIEQSLQANIKEAESLKKNIEFMKSKLKSEHIIYMWKKAKKAAYLDSIEKAFNEKRQNCENKIQFETDKSQRMLRKYSKSSMELQTELAKEIYAAREEHEKLLKDHGATQKLTRDEKNKLILQLQALIKKYDTSMLQKMTEIAEMEENVKSAEKDLDNFMKIYYEEEKIYNEIVVRNEQETERKKMEIILKYTMNRAARKIQRYWRKWRRTQLRKIRRLKR